MPRYYCDYCDTYLTHDSPSVRKQHNAGYKHKANVRSYYQQFEEQQTQSLIDQRVKEHLGQTAAFQQQVGAAFQQHLAALQSGQQRPRVPVPILPPPTLPVPGSTQLPNNQPLVPPLRPPVLPRPTTGPPAYGVSMGTTPPLRPPGAPATSSPGMAQSSGLSRPPPLTPPLATGIRPSTPTSSPMANGIMSSSSLPSASSTYQNQQPNSVPTSGAYGTYNYAAPPTSYSQHNTSTGLPNPTYVPPQPPRVSTLSSSSALSNPSTPPSAGNSDSFIYGQAPTSHGN
uniref:U1 small nuclear ribonucleoprotein C n=1 Tax=Wollemia nobilis TaxID=56998 RepID=A0A0C9RP09_9CONI